MEGLQLVDFPVTGRGVQASRSFKAGEVILTVEREKLWTVDAAREDHFLGPIIIEHGSQLDVDNTLAIFLLFVKFHATGYEERKKHIDSLPREYTTTLFFDTVESDVYKGTSVDELTRRLNDQVQEDYEFLIKTVFSERQDIFPLDKITLDEVCFILIYFIYFVLFINVYCLFNYFNNCRGIRIQRCCY